MMYQPYNIFRQGRVNKQETRGYKCISLVWGDTRGQYFKGGFKYEETLTGFSLLPLQCSLH